MTQLLPSSPSSALSPPSCGRYHLPWAAKVCSQQPEGERQAGGCSEAGEVRESRGEQAWRNIQGTSGNRNGLRSGKGTGLWLQVRGDLLGAVKCWRYTLQGPSPLAAHSVSATLTVQEKRPTKPQASFCDFLWKWSLPPRLLSPLRIHKTTTGP